MDKLQYHKNKQMETENNIMLLNYSRVTKQKKDRYNLKILLKVTAKNKPQFLADLLGFLYFF
jgi:hypothetical protein